MQVPLQGYPFFRNLLRLAGDDSPGSESSGITFGSWEEGTTILPFILSEDIYKGYNPPTEVGSLTVDLTFHTALTSVIKLYVCGCYSDSLTIDPATKTISTSYVPGAFG